MSNANTRAALANRRGDAYRNGHRATSNNGQREHKPAQAPAIPALNRRRPTGAVPWPFILIEGGEKTGKVWDMITLSTSDRVGDCNLLDLSEGGADEYGAIPGANYWVLEHDGSWGSIMGQIRAVRQSAAEARERGDKPTCLFIDSGSLIWTGLSQWAEQLARRSPAGQRALRDNPNAEVTVTFTHWNAANKRWRAMMTLLLTFPGIVVMSARGKWVTAIDDNGKPAEDDNGKPYKEYKVEGQKDLAYDATVWVRKLRDGTTQIIGARSVHAGIRPGGSQPKEVSDGRFTLEWLIFDVLKCDPDKAHVRDLKDLDGDRGEAHEEIERDKARAAQGSPLVPRDPRERAWGTHPGIRPGESGDHENVDGISGDHENTPPDWSEISSHGRLNGVPVPGPDSHPGDDDEDNDRSEDEALEFAQYAEEVVRDGTTRAAIKALWDEAEAKSWLDQPLPGRQDTTRALLTSRTDALKTTPRGVGA